MLQPCPVMGHKAYDLVQNTFGDATTTPNEQGVTMKEQYYPWAIPQREMNANTR